jgi:peptidoglycan-N-acetylglucosamine deacetylase
VASERGILCLTFDNMGHAAEVGRGLRAGPDAQELDLIAGYPALLGLLDDLDQRATFFIEGWNALHHPNAVRELADRGHEIGIHGWVHEVFHSLDATAAERVVADAQAAFRLLGIDPQGFRAPGGTRGAYTAGILTKLGIRFDSSIDEDAETMVPRLLDGDIPSVPWQWPMVDYYQYIMHPDGPRTPSQLESLWTRRLDQAARDGSLLTVIFHAFVSCVDADRFAVVKRLLRRAKEDARLEVLTAGQVADRVRRRLMP